MSPITIDIEVLKDTYAKQKTDVKIPKCWVCHDEGYILYNKKTDGREYEYIAHCTCEAGNKYKYDGTTCKKPSPFYVPGIDEIVDPEELAKENIGKFMEKYKDNPEILKKLQESLRKV